MPSSTLLTRVELFREFNLYPLWKRWSCDTFSAFMTALLTHCDTMQTRYACILELSLQGRTKEMALS